MAGVGDAVRAGIDDDRRFQPRVVGADPDDDVAGSRRVRRLVSGMSSRIHSVRERGAGLFVRGAVAAQRFSLSVVGV